MRYRDELKLVYGHKLLDINHSTKKKYFWPIFYLDLPKFVILSQSDLDHFFTMVNSWIIKKMTYFDQIFEYLFTSITHF